MKRSKRSQRGFTIIELIMVIVVLGFLAVAALPQYVNLTTRAAEGNRDGVAGGVRAGIATALASSFAAGNNNPTFPAALDAVGNVTCDTAVTCFNLVIPGGVTDGNWQKTAASSYLHSETSTTFSYDSATGTFT